MSKKLMKLAKASDFEILTDPWDQKLVERVFAAIFKTLRERGADPEHIKFQARFAYCTWDEIVHHFDGFSKDFDQYIENFYGTMTDED